jgi:hypothetical protein
VAVLRRLTPVQRRLLLALFACAMVARALVPAGWMPSAGGGLMLCDGVAPVTAAPAAMMAQPGMTTQPGMHHGGHDAPVPGHPQPGDHPCAFAGPVAAVEAPQPGVPLPPAALRPAMPPSRLAVSVGHGLAAPPPPPTGPPAFA